jgi:short-subunit dehydrogenase
MAEAGVAARPAGRRRALITGALAGIGALFARRLARDCYDLVLTARCRDRLEQLAQRLRDEQGAAVQVAQADLTRADDLATVEQLAADDPVLELLVNNAGFAGYMPFAQLDADRAEELIRLHVAVTRLTRAASLAALRLEDMLHSPGLDEPALVEQYRASERQLLAGALSGRLAARYHNPPSSLA